MAIYLENYLPVVKYQGIATKESFMLESSYRGTDQFDSTHRITLQSYQQALQSKPWGEIMRFDLMRDDAKAMLTWRDRYTNPSSPRTVAWIGAHYKHNGEGGPEVHKHISIETDKADGTVVTRFEIPFGADRVLCQFQNSDAQVNSGYMAVTNAAGNNREFQIRTSTEGEAGATVFTKRWAIRGDNTAESGSNVGTDLRISALDDSGNFIADAAFFERKRARVAFGTTDVAEMTGKVTIYSGSDEVLLRLKNAHSGATNSAMIAANGDNVADRVLQATVASDTVSRFNLEVTGKMEWGAGGSSARDTNLYRSAADTLKTDDSLIVGAALSHLGTTAGFYSTTPVAQQVLATGAGATVDNVITALQNLGLVKQS